jgi:ATP-dependent helicase/nuclease subunit A
MITHADPEKPRDLVAILRQFTDIEIKKVKFDKWPEGERRAREERSTWQDYKKRSDAYLDDWRRHCYHTLIKAIQGCQAVYDRLREEKGLLNFQDLLLKAAALLADKPKIREYFRHRFTRLLVDEFQDTDPIQAQVMMFLTANDPTETDWQRCRPVPGSLFVVGDPKQSIYRFRRADIVTYNKVKEIIVNNGGKIVLLQANFRSAAPLIDWINRTFEKSFSSSESPESPAYVTLLPGPQAGEVCQQPHLQCLQIPLDVPTDQICEYEATLVARAILDAINDNGVPPESRTASGRVDARPAQPRDFLIITRYTKNLGVYSRKLQEAGIPHQVVGGNAVNQSRELSMLHVCLAAVVQPDNPVALVAALRSELFGISDSALYDFKQKGGSFSFASSIPTGLADADAAALSDAFERLRKYSVWFNIMPSVAAAEKVAADLGLAVLSAAEPDGNSRAGSFLKAFELLRAVHYDLWAATDLVDYLAQILQGEEVHDGLPALPQETSAVQVMNLHKAKGLEAPFVFLADPTGEINHGTDLYIDRSGDEVKGYMVIRGPTAGFAGPVLGMPQQWNTLKAQEKRFRDAESTRLFYVAATRAGKQLTITQRGKIKQGGNRWNPWKFFQDHLLECPILVDRGGDRELKVNPVSIGDEDAWRAEAQIGGRWRVVAQPTYETAGAKAISMARPTLAPPGAEYGTEWGSILHSLLETAMLNDRADLGSLAQTALAEQGLAADLVEDLVETVHAVMASDIWKRAMHSPRRLVEVPFQTLVSTESGEAGPVATILRGVIDLAFLEAGAWVIVDYKTDRVSSTHLGRLVERYREQVLTYAKAWAAVTGEIVGEVGLFFTHCDRYVVL